jgi:hypothetical protein
MDALCQDCEQLAFAGRTMLDAAKPDRFLFRPDLYECATCGSRWRLAPETKAVGCWLLQPTEAE